MSKREKIEHPNPLANHLASIHSATIGEIEFLARGRLEIAAIHGFTVTNGECRKSTDDEAAKADLNLLGIDTTVDMRGNLAADVARKLRELSHHLNAIARKIENRLKRGTLPIAVDEYYLRDAGERVSGSYSRDDMHSAFYAAMRHHAQVVRVACDGSEDVIHDFTESDTAA